MPGNMDGVVSLRATLVRAWVVCTPAASLVPAHAQFQRWYNLSEQAQQLRSEGNDAAALPVEQQAEKVAEATWGPNGTAFITGRSSPARARRAEELKVTLVYLGQEKKNETFEECMQKAGVTGKGTASWGDGLSGVPLARRPRLAVCVATGAPELAAICQFRTRWSEDTELRARL